MTRKMGYPRGEASRRDRILNHDIIHGTARNHLARQDVLAGNPHKSNVAPTQVLGGTVITDGVTVEQFVNGGETIIITLTNDDWHPDLGGNNAITTAFINSISGEDEGGSEGWEEGTIVLTHAHVVRTSAKVVTVTLPAGAGYNATNGETVSYIGVASSYSRGVVPAGFHNFDVRPISFALTGTVIAGGVQDSEIVAGGETLIMTLTGDTWAATLGSDNALTTAFLAGFTSNHPSENNFTAEVALVHGNLVRTSSTVMTLTLPASAGYDVTGGVEVNTFVPTADSMALAVIPAGKSFTVDVGE